MTVPTAILAILLGATLGVVQDGTKSPVPEASAIKAAEKLVREIFKDEYSKVAPADVKALALKFLEKETESRDDPASSYVLLREAKDLLASIAEVDAAFKAVLRLDERYTVDAVAMKFQVLEVAEKRAPAPEISKVILDHYARLIDEALDQERYDLAKTAIPRAEKLARAAKLVPLLAQLKSRGEEADRLQKQSALLKSMEKTLLDQPDDPAANLAMGKYLCFQKDAWEEGLPRLAKGSDPALKSAAQEDLAKGAQPKSETELGDLWFAVAEKWTVIGEKKGLQRRAARWYLQALPALAGLTRVKIEKRLEGLKPALTEREQFQARTAPAFEILIEAYIDGLSTLHVTPTGIYWESGGVAKPGLHEGSNEPTWVNSKQWFPAWGKPKEGRGIDQSEPFPIKVGPIENLTITLVAVGTTRQATTIEQRDPITTRVNKGEFTVFIPDSQAGPRWYLFKIHR